MPLVSDIHGFFHLAADLRPFLRQKVTPEVARERVHRRLRTRGASFLEIVERSVFGNPRSPYLRLFQTVGCEIADVRRLVEQEGVEGTLQKLHAAGVYVSFEEFKGRKPAVRGSQTFHFRNAEFDNPLHVAHEETSTGGTSGPPAPVRTSLRLIEQAAPNYALWFDSHNWRDRPLILWTPSVFGVIGSQLPYAKIGMTCERWFGVVRWPTWRARLQGPLVRSLVRLFARVPRPEIVSVEEPAPVLDCLFGLLDAGKQPLLRTFPSGAVRLSAAARERGQSLKGVSFLLGYEPLTPARHQAIQDSGASAIPMYGTSECIWIGAQFPDARVPDEVRIFRDAYAVIQDGRSSSSEAGSAKPIMVTHLRTAGAKVALNLEIGDSAVLEADPDHPVAQAYGYDLKMHTIRSFRKITAWGVTLALGDLYAVLEEALPMRFGGVAGDYQLIEQQTDHGIPRLRLLVRPELGELDGTLVARAFLQELSKRGASYRFTSEIWSKASALAVERSPAVSTSRGKTLPVITLSAESKKP